MPISQRTLKAPVTLTGIGLHSGAAITLRLLPAPACSGIVFVRTDVQGEDNRIPALWSNVVDTRLCTVVANASGVRVSTIEHLMAALRGSDISNVIIELDGPEVPIMDGSAAAFIAAIDAARTQDQDAPIYAIKVLSPIMVEEGNKSVRLMPAILPSYAGEIMFDHAAIGQQMYKIDLVNGNFRHELADSRTFGLFEEVSALQSMGLARGGSLDNAIVVNRDGIMNPGGLRHEDEFIRHKLLDAVGDLYLAGAPVIAAYEGVRPSHAMNNAVLKALFAAPDKWVRIPMGMSEEPTLDGSARQCA